MARETKQHGPDEEQLETGEDVERLAEIGDLIRSGNARLEDFDLGRYETAFVRGYVARAGEADQQEGEHRG